MERILDEDREEYMGIFSEMSIDDENYDREFCDDGSVEQAKELSYIPSQEKESNSEKKLKIASTSAAGNKNPEVEKQAAHEKAEKERQEQWEHAKQEKETREKLTLEEIASMDDATVINSAIEHITMQGERITRRNMKMCVIDHIKNCCRDNPAFARLLKHPRKNMINCFAYITRHAMEYIRKDLKIDGDIPYSQIGYGEDVPDDLCYQWAVEYFYDPDAEEDKEREKEFIPKPYKSKKESIKKKNSKVADKQADQATFSGQMSLFDTDNHKEKAG